MSTPREQPKTSGRTRLAGLVGWPVDHSLSPAMQEAAFAALGLDLRYLAFAVEPARLDEALAGAAALGFVGLNVTAPHKEAALVLCDPDADARAVRAVNTLVFTGGGGGRPRGLNTDVHGFRMLLEEMGAAVAGRRALVLGAGGAARAVTSALLQKGAHVAMAARTPRAVAFAARSFGQRWQPALVISWELIVSRLPDTDLLVDATPRGHDAGSTLDVAQLPRDATVIDLAVRQSTNLVAAAQARGLRTATGEAMLLHQGARSFTAWTGLEAPLHAMRTALHAAMAREV